MSELFKTKLNKHVKQKVFTLNVVVDHYNSISLISFEVPTDQWNDNRTIWFSQCMLFYILDLFYNTLGVKTCLLIKLSLVF